MKKLKLLSLALVAAALLTMILAGMVRRVPEGREGVLARSDGGFTIYSPGWHFTRPFAGDFVLYPSGRFEVRYPAHGQKRIMTREGLEAQGAFLFELEVPRGSAEELYREFGHAFASRLEMMLYDAIEIAAAGFAPAAVDDASESFLNAIAAELQASFSQLPLVVRKVEPVAWGDAGARARADISEKPLRRIVCIGVDGADWLVINPLIEEGLLPNFERFVSGGASGILLSMEPMLSPLLWTTMATGKLPEEHGILNFTVIDPETGATIPVTRLQRRVDAVWNMLSDYGRSVDVVGWLATYPAERISGVMVSDRAGYLAFAATGPSDVGAGAVSPPELQDEIMELVVMGRDVSFEELQRFMRIGEAEFKRNRRDQFEAGNPINNMILIYAAAKSYRDITLHLLERGQPDFLAVYFEFVDAVKHLFMSYAPPRMDGVGEQEYRQFKDAVREAYVYQDRVIGEIIERCEPGTVFMLVSDHGFKSGASRLKADADMGGGHAAKWHQIEGVIALLGDGIRRGHQMETASLIDVAPTILALAGFPKVLDMPGSATLSAFEPSLLEALSSGTVATLERFRSVENGARELAAADEALMKKLEALGYLTPDNPSALNNLGLRYQNEGQYEKAIEQFKKALELQPNFAAAINHLGICYGQLERFDDARGCFERALEINPGNISALNNLAVINLRTGRMDEAGMLARRALEIEPQYASAHHTLGSVLAMEGELSEAEKSFEAALRIEPGNRAFRASLEELRQHMRGRR